MSWHYQIAHRVHQNGDHWYSIREAEDGQVPEILAIEYGWGNDPGYWVAPRCCEKWRQG